ncbi:class I SAM-dependent methyltransferase [Alkaliphilus hydrothermalis]|uniref:Ubiquinone/menaquinone biosynthesis C-methylase UbiE n=1 Tax=Alkaliphilus hydrothermalis TaxID=1482730 RepID=A0ABS2NN56_9FIRM|nr:class I SAM-dependent methyltransferase [Alkaliphilus hydrothermalis]MBM7614337.1 ubiquinone/menaquinone biosynthesis C-methylase UbiE [Alkaliphilus hydrothermalis]
MNQDERMYIIENQKVTIEREINGDKILDIGGGGEGVIGLCYGKNVVAIDPRKDELEEAPDGPLKIVMDARELSFLENSFDAVTSFFTLMYISKKEHEKVFNEIYNVLKKDGEFVLWDTIIPKYDGDGKDIFVIQLEIITPAKLLKTGYGVSRKDTEQDIEYFVKLGQKIGFNVIKREKQDQIFKIVFKK